MLLVQVEFPVDYQTMIRDQACGDSSSLITFTKHVFICLLQGILTRMKVNVNPYTWHKASDPALRSVCHVRLCNQTHGKLTRINLLKGNTKS